MTDKKGFPNPLPSTHRHDANTPLRKKHVGEHLTHAGVLHQQTQKNHFPVVFPLIYFLAVVGVSEPILGILDSYIDGMKNINCEWSLTDNFCQTKLHICIHINIYLISSQWKKRCSSSFLPFAWLNQRHKILHRKTFPYWTVIRLYTFASVYMTPEFIMDRITL